jgi:hypothetical protein
MADQGFDAKVWTDPQTGATHVRNWNNFRNGNIPWSELDDQELSRAQVRDKNGGFSGKPPSLVPREMIGDIRRRLLERYNQRIAEQLLDLQGVFLDIARDDTASPADRMKAAAYMQERLIGKIPDKVEIQAEVKPWEGMVAGILEEQPDA